MKTLITVNGQDYYSEEMAEPVPDNDAGFRERVSDREYAVKIAMIIFREKFLKVKNRKTNCQLWLVFQSKMNEEETGDEHNA